MRTTFGTFNIATSGLFASQRALDITSHNIANANTEGYSRQQALQRATLPTVGDPTGVVGTGVETYDIIRLRSEYLDQKYWGQNKTYNEWKVKQDHLEELEGIFNEPSETGIRKAMDEFFTALEELSKKPGDSTCRVAVNEKANTLAVTINRNGHELLNSVRDTNLAIKSRVDEINSLSQQIASLNKHIFSFELGGHKANDLRDQRNALVDKMSSIVNISTNEIPGANGNNYFEIKISGITLVSHTNYNKLTTVEESVTNAEGNGITDMGGGKISRVVWADAESQQVKIEGGELKGLLDMRDGDGNGFNYRGLPYYLNKLNEFAKSFTAAFNAQHQLGVDTAGNPGGNFFYQPTAPKEVNCLNFQVDSSILANPGLIAASSEFNGESNNGNVILLIDLRKSTSMFSTLKGTPDDFIKSVLSALSVDASQASRMTSNAESLAEQTKNRRLSESGVSLDEEMANMVKYQQAYNASARMITTLDQVLDTMINRLGVVGR